MFVSFVVPAEEPGSTLRTYTYTPNAHWNNFNSQLHTGPVHSYARDFDRNRQPADHDCERHRAFVELLEGYFLLETLNAKRAFAETNMSFSITRSV
jgi:hypothetical protein